MFEPQTIQLSPSSAAEIVVENGRVRLIHSGKYGDADVTTMSDDDADTIAGALKAAAAANRANRDANASRVR